MSTIFGVPAPALFGQLLLGLINGSFYAILSLGLAVIFGLLNIINFTHGAQYMLGAFCAYFLLNALGMNYWQTMGNIVLPQAFRNMIPVLLTQTIILFQDTSLVYVLSITDFLGAASKVAQRDGRLVEMYLFAAAVYFVISFAASSLVRRLQARVAIVR